MSSHGIQRGEEFGLQHVEWFESNRHADQFIANAERRTQVA